MVHFARNEPLHRLVDMHSWFTSDEFAQKTSKMDVGKFISINSVLKSFRYGDVTTDFFLNFANKSLFGRFTRLDFATWKLPVSAVYCGVGTLDTEDFSILLNNGADDMDIFLHGGLLFLFIIA